MFKMLIYSLVFSAFSKQTPDESFKDNFLNREVNCLRAILN